MTPVVLSTSLIVGKRDLKPILEKMEKDKKVFVAFDSCFSGNSVRALGLGRARYVDLGLPAPSVSYKGKKAEPYPYRNVIYISASDENEKAVDLPDGAPTLDGKAHGAMSDALIRGLSGSADTNGDRTLTYEELYGYVRSDVQRKATHTPQLLYNTGDPGQVGEPVFDGTVKVEGGGRPALGLYRPSEDLRVKQGKGVPADMLRRAACALRAGAGRPAPGRRVPEGLRIPG